MTCLVPCLFKRSSCARLSTQRQRVDFPPVPFITKESLQPKVFVHYCLYTEVSLSSSSKREFLLAACAFENTASFRTQLSTYSRRFITSVEHKNSAEREISDLSTDLSLSLSTIYNLGAWLFTRAHNPSNLIETWRFPFSTIVRDGNPLLL